MQFFTYLTTWLNFFLSTPSTFLFHFPSIHAPCKPASFSCTSFYRLLSTPTFSLLANPVMKVLSAYDFIPSLSLIQLPLWFIPSLSALYLEPFRTLVAYSSNFEILVTPMRPSPPPAAVFFTSNRDALKTTAWHGSLKDNAHFPPPHATRDHCVNCEHEINRKTAECKSHVLRKHKCHINRVSVWK